jgi:hypothetical protein
VSDYADFIDDAVLQIQAQVAGFDTSIVPDDIRHVHRYAPWNPLDLVADGNRHLAMWPLPDAEAASPLAQNVQQVHTLQHVFAVLAWEDAAPQNSRQMPDEAKDRAWLDVANGLRDFFYVEANRQRAYAWGGYYRITHVGTTFPETPQAVRWVALTITADRTIAFS